MIWLDNEKACVTNFVMPSKTAPKTELLSSVLVIALQLIADELSSKPFSKLFEDLYIRVVIIEGIFDRLSLT